MIVFCTHDNEPLIWMNEWIKIRIWSEYAAKMTLSIPLFNRGAAFIWETVIDQLLIKDIYLLLEQPCATMLE